MRAPPYARSSPPESAPRSSDRSARAEARRSRSLLSEREVPIAVLASGTGTNFQALLDADLGPAKIVLLISNKPGAKALERAERAGVPTVVIDHRSYASREDFDRAVLARLHEARAEWIVFAG